MFGSIPGFYPLNNNNKDVSRKIILIKKKLQKITVFIWLVGVEKFVTLLR